MIVIEILAALYVLGTASYIVSENRAPQSSFAWMLLFVALPGVGVVIYLLVGREHKAFSKQRHLTGQNTPPELSDMVAALHREHGAAMQAFRSDPQAYPQIAELVHSSAHSLVTTRNRVTVLQDASTAYPEMFDAMRAARSSIHLHFYIWNSDRIGHELLDLLAAKVRDGVEVRILFDPVGSFFGMRRSYLRAMRVAGIQMYPFSALWRLHTISYRNHRKLVVIDGHIGFTGGLNIGDEHLTGPPGFGCWRDTHVRVEGSAVLSMQAIFVVDWINATGERLGPARLFLPPDGETAPDCRLPLQICLSGPDTDWHAIRQLYFQMINSARSEILIQSPFFVLDTEITAALRIAAMSGVDVRVMISARGPRQFVPYWAANTFAAEVARAGVRVLMYDAGYLHSKTIVVDGAVCCIGSANWDIRSFSINYELTAVFYDRGIAGQIRAAFMQDEDGCHPFDPRAYAARPRLLRFRDSVARLASPLL